MKWNVATGWLVSLGGFGIAYALAGWLTHVAGDPVRRLGWSIRFEVPAALRLGASPNLREPALIYDAGVDTARRNAAVVARVYVQEVRPADPSSLSLAIRRAMRNVLGSAQTQQARDSPRREIRMGAFNGEELRVEDGLVVVVRACFAPPDRAYVWVLTTTPDAADSAELLLDALTQSVAPRVDADS